MAWKLVVRIGARSKEFWFVDQRMTSLIARLEKFSREGLTTGFELLAIRDVASVCSHHWNSFKDVYQWILN